MKLLAVIILLLVATKLLSQTHNEVWAKVMVIKKVKQKLLISGEYQHRTQSNYLVPDKAVFHNPLSNLYRVWFNYKLKNNWELVASPFAYFNNYDIASVSGLTKKSREIRIAAGINKGYSFKNVVNKNRFLYEVRFLNYNNPHTLIQQRLRLQNTLIVPIVKISKSRLNINVQQEFILKNQSGFTNFDQERLATILQLKAKYLEYNVGYQYCIQKATTNTIYKNQFLIGSTVNF